MSDTGSKEDVLSTEEIDALVERTHFRTQLYGSWASTRVRTNAADHAHLPRQRNMEFAVVFWHTPGETGFALLVPTPAGASHAPTPHQIDT